MNRKYSDLSILDHYLGMYRKNSLKIKFMEYSLNLLLKFALHIKVLLHHLLSVNHFQCKIAPHSQYQDNIDPTSHIFQPI